MIDRSAKELDPLKIELCNAIDRVIHRYQWSQDQAAACMRTHRTTVSRVQNKFIDKLTLNQLFKYLARLCPDYRFFLSIDSSLSGV